MLLLTGNIGKAYKVRHRFLLFRQSTKLTPFFPTWSLEHSQNLRMLITFSRSERLESIAAEAL